VDFTMESCHSATRLNVWKRQMVSKRKGRVLRIQRNFNLPGIP
jgi:hypothetical protein